MNILPLALLLISPVVQPLAAGLETAPALTVRTTYTELTAREWTYPTPAQMPTSEWPSHARDWAMIAALSGFPSLHRCWVWHVVRMALDDAQALNQRPVHIQVVRVSGGHEQTIWEGEKWSR